MHRSKLGQMAATSVRFCSNFPSRPSRSFDYGGLSLREVVMNRSKPWTAYHLLLVAAVLTCFFSAGQNAHGQSLPATPGETLSGRHIVLSDAVRGHAAVLILGFSKDAGDGCGAWAKALRSDPALVGIRVFQAAMLEQAPGFVRGMIKNSMRKGLSPSEQDSFVILTQDEKQWRSYFKVTADKDPYVVVLDAAGKARWLDHGTASDLESQVRSVRP